MDRRPCETSIGRRDRRPRETPLAQGLHSGWRKCFPLGRTVAPAGLPRGADRRMQRPSSREPLAGRAISPLAEECACAPMKLEHEGSACFVLPSCKEMKRPSNPTCQACTRCRPVRFLSPLLNIDSIQICLQSRDKVDPGYHELMKRLVVGKKELHAKISCSGQMDGISGSYRGACPNLAVSIRCRRSKR